MGALRTAVFAMSLALLAPGAVEAQRFGGGGYGFDPSRLQGQDVGAAQGDLSGRGFIKARNIRIGAQQWDLWYNDRDRKGCVGFTSYNGRITEARTFEDSECGRDNASNPPPGRPGFDIDR